MTYQRCIKDHSIISKYPDNIKFSEYHHDGATLKAGIRNPESKNKAKQSSSNTQKSSCAFLACKSKKVNKKWLQIISNSIIHIQYIQI